MIWEVLQNTKEILWREKNQEKENSTGKESMNMKAHSKTVKWMEMASAR